MHKHDGWGARVSEELAQHPFDGSAAIFAAVGTLLVRGAAHVGRSLEEDEVSARWHMQPQTVLHV